MACSLQGGLTPRAKSKGHGLFPAGEDLPGWNVKSGHSQHSLNKGRCVFHSHVMNDAIDTSCLPPSLSSGTGLHDPKLHQKKKSPGGFYLQ
jgi:hypothetical protein